jgi:hypothetical protein
MPRGEQEPRQERRGLLRRSSFGAAFERSNQASAQESEIQKQTQKPREFTPELKRRMEEIYEKNKDMPLVPGLYSLERTPDVPVPSSHGGLPVWKVAGRISINEF